MTFGQLKTGDSFQLSDGCKYVKTTNHRLLDKRRTKTVMNAVSLETGKSAWMDDRVVVIKCETK